MNWITRSIRNYWFIIFAIIISLGFNYQIFFGKIPVPSDDLVGLYNPWRDFYSVQYPRGMTYKNFLITDPIRQLIPWRKLAIDQIKSGSLPGWNPYSFSGTSIAANIQSSAFNPLNLIFFIFNFISGWTILIVLQQILAFIGMYIYLKSTSKSIYASVFGALIWIFCGFMIAWYEWGTMVFVAAWIPYGLWAIDRLLKCKEISNCSRILSAILMTSVIILIYVSGHIQIAFYSYLVIFMYVLWRIKQSESRELYWKNVRTIIFSSIVGLSLVLILSIPFLKYIIYSSRIIQTDSWLQDGWFVPWQHLIQFLIPDFFGNPSTLNYWGTWNYGEMIGYIGFIPILLAIFSLAKSSDKFILFWKVILFGSLTFILPNPISRLPFLLEIPIISALQPTRLMVLIDLSLAILAADGFEKMIRDKYISKWMITISVTPIITYFLIKVYFLYLRLPVDEKFNITLRNSALPMVMGLFSMVVIIIWNKFRAHLIIRKIIIISIIILSGVDLFRFGWKFTPFTDTKLFFPATKSIQYLESLPEPNRIAFIDDRLVPANSNSYFNLESIDGYDPINSLRYSEFIAATERGSADLRQPFGFSRIITPKNFKSKLFDLLAVNYIVSLSQLNDLNLKLIYQEGNTRVYEKIDAIPRWALVSKYTRLSDKVKILTYLYQPEFRPDGEVVLENDIPYQNTSVINISKISLQKYSDSDISIRVTTENPQIFVIFNPFDPNWKAKINGKEAKIYRADYLFMALILPAGNNFIDFKYDAWNI